MRRLATAAIAAALVSVLAAGSVLAGKPIKERIDIGDPAFEAFVEERLLSDCGYPIDVEGRGHINIHVFEGHRHLIEIDNYRMFQTFSANGKSVTTHPDSGPDILFIGRDGVAYIALTGRSLTGSGVIGRTLAYLDTFEIISSNGNEVWDFITMLCETLAPED